MRVDASRAPQLSAAIYTSLSLLAAGVFLTVTLIGEYGWIARAGGALWVFTLSMIILMPIVPGIVRRMLGEREEREPGADSSALAHH